MNTARGLIGVTALLAACGSSDAPPPPQDTAPRDTAASVAASPAFTYIELRDSAAWQLGPLSGTRATLVVRGEMIDLAETSSVQPLAPSSVIYQQIESSDMDEEECGGPCYNLTQWMLYDGTHRPLDQMLPLFDRYFSAPAAVGDVIYYWGLDAIAGTDSVRVTANRVSVTDSSHTSLFLYNDALATDDPGYFQRPRTEGDDVIFETFRDRFVTDRQLRSVRAPR
jgi:hypothetical protein